MNRKFLEDLGLEKDAIDTILNEHHSSIGVVTQERDTARLDLTTSQGLLAQRDTDLAALQANATLTEDQKIELEDLKVKYAADKQAYDDKLAQNKIDAAFEIGIAKSGTKDEVALRAHLADIRKNAVLAEDGSITGLTEAITGKRESHAYLFEETGAGGAPQGTPPKVELTKEEQIANNIFGR